jgi:hypothetical protein
MLIVAIIDLPDDPDGTGGDAPDVVTEGILARVQDECRYRDDYHPYTPAEVVVYALSAAPVVGCVRHLLDAHADTAARGHGPLVPGRA